MLAFCQTRTENTREKNLESIFPLNSSKKSMHELNVDLGDKLQKRKDK